MKKVMKFKLIAALIAVMMLLIFANASGQGIKISALPTLTAPDSSADYIPIVHSGTTYKVTPGRLFHEFGASGGSGSPGGSNTHIQYNNSGAFGGSSYFTWNNSTQQFNINTSTYPSGLFNVANTNGIIVIGDYAVDANGTSMYINDNLQLISLSAGGGGIAIDGASSKVSFSTFSEAEFLIPMTSNAQAAINLKPHGTSAGNTGELRFSELAANGSNYTGFKSPDSRSANLIYTLPSTDPTSGDVLVAGVPSGGVVGLTWATIGGTGTVTSIATTSPITGGTITTTGTIGINNAAADGSTKGAASFTAADFNSSSGLISIDYANGQAATSGQKGFLTAADWSTFNGKQAAGSYLTADGAVTGATSQAQVFTSGIKTGVIDDNTAGSIEFTFSGTPQYTFTNATINAPNGTVASPTYAFSGDGSTGIYLKTANSELGAAVDGVLVGGFNTTGLFTDVISEQTAAAGVTVDGVLLKDGLVLGQYGGTGVANTGKTITLGGNLTTSGAHATTFTTTGTTGVTLPTTGTLATLAGTETFTNKSIVATQLTGTSYTFAANNTGSTAAYTLQPYEDHNIATYSGTVTWNGTAPTSITSQKYSWSRIGNTVTLLFSIIYGTPGATNTSAIITLPSDCPTPAVFADAGDAASEYMYPINGGRVEANMTGNPSAIRGGLRQNSSNNGYEIALIFGSVSAAQCQFTLIYRTQ